MPLTTVNMGLKLWNLLTDFFSHTELDNNWTALDVHDHTIGKGLQIPAGGLAPGAVTTGVIAPNAVTDTRLATASVTSTKLAAGAVGTAALADTAVTSAKWAPTSQWLLMPNSVTVLNDGNYHALISTTFSITRTTMMRIWMNLNLFQVANSTFQVVSRIDGLLISGTDSNPFFSRNIVGSGIGATTEQVGAFHSLTLAPGTHTIRFDGFAGGADGTVNASDVNNVSGFFYMLHS